MSATYRGIDAGYLVMVPPEESMPIILTGGTLTCCRCSYEWAPDTWSVTTPAGPVCPQCARADRPLATWQTVCDAADRIDAAYLAAADQPQRDLIAGHLSTVVDHFNAWRYPEAGGAT